MAPGLWAGLWQLGGTGRGWRDTRTPKARSGEAGSLLELLECSAQGCTYTRVQTHARTHARTLTHAHTHIKSSSGHGCPRSMGPVDRRAPCPVDRRVPCSVGPMVQLPCSALQGASRSSAHRPTSPAGGNTLADSKLSEAQCPPQLQGETASGSPRPAALSGGSSGHPSLGETSGERGEGLLRTLVAGSLLPRSKGTARGAW